MSDLQLVKYEEFLNDQYTKALCTILIDGKYLVTYGKKQYNNGGSEWKTGSFGVDCGLEKKKYVDSFMIDSSSENMKLLAFVEDCEKTRGGKSAQKPNSMDEVADAREMPF